MGSVTRVDGSLSLVENDSATCSPQIPSVNESTLELDLPDSILMVPSPPEPVYGNGNVELIPQPINEYEEDSLQANLDIMYLETFGNMAHASELAEIAQIEDELKLQQQMEVENEFKQAEEQLQNGLELHQMAFTFETENDGLVNEGRDLFEDMNIHHTQQPSLENPIQVPSPVELETEKIAESCPENLKDVNHVTETEDTNIPTELVEDSGNLESENIVDDETEKPMDELEPIECARSEPIPESIEMEMKKPQEDLKEQLEESEDNMEEEMEIDTQVAKIKIPETQECYVKLTEHKIPTVPDSSDSDSEDEPSNDNENSGRVLVDIESMKKVLQNRKLNKPFKVPLVPAFIHDGLDEDDELLVAFNARQDESMTHICVLCYNWFEDQAALSSHMIEKHRNNTELEKCSFCPKTFIARFLRLRHEKNHKYDAKYPMDLYFPPSHLPFDYNVPNHFYKRFKFAPFTTEFSRTIKDIKKSAAKFSYECCDCGKAFRGEEPLREHYERFHAIQLCGICKEKFFNLESLRRHEWKVHEYCPMDENFQGGAWNVWTHWEMEQMEEMKTNISNIEFMHTYAYKEEEVEEIDTATIIEKTIEKQLRVKSNFKRPLAVKGEDGVVNSLKRSRQTINQNSGSGPDKNIQKVSLTATVPQQTVSDVSSPATSTTTATTTAIICEMCNQSFPSTDEMILHVQKQHSGERPYKCQFCGRGFATHSNRKEHERIHTGERPYVCIYCSRGFVQISNLKKHMQTHKDKNNLQCKICLKQFVKDSSLLLHQRAHAVDRKFKCKHCDKAYNYSSLLKRHERIHTGEMPYSCDICSMPFHELVSLTYHRKKVHTGERPHKCSTCGRAFILSSDLKKHLKVHLKTATKEEEAEISEGSDSDSINSLLQREITENGSNSNSGSNDATPSGRGVRTYSSGGKQTPVHRKSTNQSATGNKKQKETAGSFGAVSKMKSDMKDPSVEVYDVYEDDHDEAGITVVESGTKDKATSFNKKDSKNNGRDTRVMWVENGDDTEGKFIVVDDDGNEIDGDSIQFTTVYDD